MLLQFLLDLLEPLHEVGDGSHIILEDDSLRCGGQGYVVGQPTQVRRVPIRFPDIADVVAKQEGFKALLGSPEIADGVLTCPAQVPNGFVFQAGNIHRIEIP